MFYIHWHNERPLQNIEITVSPNFRDRMKSCREQCPVLVFVIIYAPGYKMLRALRLGLCVGVHKHLVSVNYTTNAWVNWSNFCLLGVTRGRFLSMISVRKQLVSVNYRTNAWVDWSDFSVAYWGGGVTRGRFLSMISSGADPRWPLWPPSCIWFPSIRGQRLGRLIQFFCGLLGVTKGRFLSMISSTTHPAAILDLVSVD
jgi:hypothetical protein